MTRWLKISLVVIMGCGFLAMMIYALINREEISSTQIEPPLITAPTEPLKRRPDQPGGMQIPNRDKLVFDLLDSSNTTLGETGVGNAVAEPTAASIAVSESIPVVSGISTAVTEKTAEIAQVAPIQAVVPVSSVQPVVKPVEPTAVSTKLEAKPEPKVEAVKPVEKIVPKEEPKVEKVAAGSKWAVQLAAVNTKADGDAMAAKASKEFPALKGLTPRVSAVPGAKKFRVQFLGLKDREAAAAVCAKLAGKQGCFPVGAQ